MTERETRIRGRKKTLQREESDSDIVENVALDRSTDT